VEQLLQSCNLDNASATKRFERIVRKSSAAGVTADFAVCIVRGKSREAHRARFDAAHASTERIFLAYRARDDFPENPFLLR